MITIAIDLGGSNIKIGLMKRGKMISSYKTEAISDGRLEDRLGTIEEIIMKLLREKGYSLKDCQGVGVAFPGIVDIKQNKILTTIKKYQDATSIKLDEWSDKRFGLPLVIENDANAALFGEQSYGCAKGYDNVVMMILGTGVGTAAMIDGHIMRGKHFQAGDFGGHFIVSVAGRKCVCGGRGCLEAYVGSWALPELIKNDDMYMKSSLSAEKKLDYKSLLRLNKEKDVLAEKIFNNSIKYISAGIVNLVHAYDPEIIVLSGGVINGGSVIVEPIENLVNEWVYTPWGNLPISVAKDPDTSVLLGLDYLVQKEKSKYD